MTNTTHTVPPVPYVERVAQIICNGLYPEAHANGKTLADFPKATRENLLTIAEAVMLDEPAGSIPEVASQDAKALYEADMKQWFTANTGADPTCVDAWKLGYARAALHSARAAQPSPAGESDDAALLVWLMKNVNCDEIDGLDHIPFGLTLDDHFGAFREAIRAAMSREQSQVGEA